MLEIRYVQTEDKEFWYRLDRHLPEAEFENKVRDKRGYILLDDDKPVGLLRYNLFWDNTPFCTMLFVDWECHGKGYGKKTNGALGSRYEITRIWYAFNIDTGGRRSAAFL